MGARRAAVVFVVLCAACTTPSTSPSFVVQRSSGSSTSGTPTDAQAGHVFERACGTDVYGDLGRNWRADATTVGPLALVGLPGLARATTQTFGARGDRYRALKVLVVVEPGSDVTVSVPASLRGRLGLLYDPAAFKDAGGYRVADGEPAVRFEPCDLQRGTQFNGGLIAAGSGCYALTVGVDGGSTRRLRFPLGTPC